MADMFIDATEDHHNAALSQFNLLTADPAASRTHNPDGRISVTSRMESVNFENLTLKENDCIYCNHHGGLVSNNKK